MAQTSETLEVRAKELFDREVQSFVDRTPRSAKLFERAVASMPFGVTSSFQANDPHPIYLESGAGSKVTDVDGNSYVDYHNGFGAMAVGHAHPKVRAAIERAASTGTHFAATTETAIAFAEEIKRRFGVEKVRFTNSGTEATMDAVRLGRAFSGKPVLLKIEGSYHGHHDAVMYSIVPSLDSSGMAERPWTVPFSRGIPDETAEGTKIVPFNDPDALEGILSENSDIGVLIMEPVMMNIGIVVPLPGYLEKVRELCTKYGVVLVFDEVKTGCTIGPGGATEMFGVQPDLVTLAKAIGGGTPVGAFAGRADIMDEIEHGVAALGTFNGNPLSMAAGLATLTEVLTKDGYEHLSKLGTRLAEGCSEAARAAGIPAIATDLGCKGSITFGRDRPIERYRDFLEVEDSLFDAFWFWMVNRGVYVTPGKEEQWTISVQHSEDDIDLFVETFAGYCKEVTG